MYTVYSYTCMYIYIHICKMLEFDREAKSVCCRPFCGRNDSLQSCSRELSCNVMYMHSVITYMYVHVCIHMYCTCNCSRQNKILYILMEGWFQREKPEQDSNPQSPAYIYDWLYVRMYMYICGPIIMMISTAGFEYTCAADKRWHWHAGIQYFTCACKKDLQLTIPVLKACTIRV